MIIAAQTHTHTARSPVTAGFSCQHRILFFPLEPIRHLLSCGPLAVRSSTEFLLVHFGFFWESISRLTDWRSHDKRVCWSITRTTVLRLVDYHRRSAAVRLIAFLIEFDSFWFYCRTYRFLDRRLSISLPLSLLTDFSILSVQKLNELSLDSYFWAPCVVSITHH